MQDTGGFFKGVSGHVSSWSAMECRIVSLWLSTWSFVAVRMDWLMQWRGLVMVHSMNYVVHVVDDWKEAHVNQWSCTISYSIHKLGIVRVILVMDGDSELQLVKQLPKW